MMIVKVLSRKCEKNKYKNNKNNRSRIDVCNRRFAIIEWRRWPSKTGPVPWIYGEQNEVGRTKNIYIVKRNEESEKILRGGGARVVGAFMPVFVRIQHAPNVKGAYIHLYMYIKHIKTYTYLSVYIYKHIYAFIWFRRKTPLSCRWHSMIDDDEIV